MVIRIIDVVKLLAVLALAFEVDCLMIISALGRRPLSAALALSRSTPCARPVASLYCSSAADSSCASSSTGPRLQAPLLPNGAGPKVNFYSLTEELLQQMVLGWGQPKFRSKQV